LVDDAPRDERPAALQRRPETLQLLGREPELDLQIPQLRRPRRGEVPQQRVVLQPLELGSANGIQQPRDLRRDEQVLAAMHRQHEVAASAELAEPGVLRARPLAEPQALRRVRLLVTSLEEARQRGVRGARQQPAIQQELLRLVERLQRPVRRQPALEGATFPKLLHTRVVGAHPTAAIVTIGNELVSGDIANTNGSWLAARLEELGFDVILIAALPDDEQRVSAFVRVQAQDADILVVTGGLGGTPDDLTREAIGAAFELPLVEQPEVAARLRERFERAPDYAARWAQLPEGSRSMEIERGGAPGFVLGNVYVLPGLPAEMEAMFELVAVE